MVLVEMVDHVPASVRTSISYFFPLITELTLDQGGGGIRGDGGFL